MRGVVGIRRAVQMQRGLQPMSCCGSISGHTHGCFLVSDYARVAPDHRSDESCEHCERRAAFVAKHGRLPLPSDGARPR